MEKVKLGDRAKDRISGFEGIVTAKTKWLYGCVRVGIAPLGLDEKGNVYEAQWFDIGQVEVVWKKAIQVDTPTIAPAKVVPTGGPARETDRGH